MILIIYVVVILFLLFVILFWGKNGGRIGISVFKVNNSGVK